MEGNKMVIAHIAGEILIISGMSYYFTKRISNLTKKIEDLEKQITEGASTSGGSNKKIFESKISELDDRIDKVLEQTELKFNNVNESNKQLYSIVEQLISENMTMKHTISVLQSAIGVNQPNVFQPINQPQPTSVRGTEGGNQLNQPQPNMRQYSPQQIAYIKQQQMLAHQAMVKQKQMEQNKNPPITSPNSEQPISEKHKGIVLPISETSSGLAVRSHEYSTWNFSFTTKC